MTKDVKKKIEKNIKIKVSKKAEEVVNNFCNGTLARGVTASALAKVLR